MNENKKTVTDLTELMPFRNKEEILKENTTCDGYINLLEKIQEGKKIFTESGVKKSGYNSFQKYHYYELKDIVPAVINLCDLLALSTSFEFREDEATLRVVDLESGAFIDYHCPLPHVYGEDTKRVMQDIGACQTYARRYLYLALLDITETDCIDNRNRAGEGTGKKDKQIDTKSKTVKRNRKEKPKYKSVSTPSKWRERKTPYENVRGDITKSQGFILGKQFSEAVSESGLNPTTDRIRKHALNKLQQQKITKNEYDNVIQTLEQLPQITD